MLLREAFPERPPSRSDRPRAGIERSSTSRMKIGFDELGRAIPPETIPPGRWGLCGSGVVLEMEGGEGLRRRSM